MPYNYIEDLILENTRIIHRNFEGRAGKYTREGDRGFSAVIDPSIVQSVIDAGWNVRELPPREDVEGSEPLYFIPVRVNLDGNRPPRICLATRTGLVELDAESLKTLDSAEIVSCDMTLHAHRWGDETKGGVKAYLKNLYVKIQEDPLADKYERYYNGEQ